MKNIIFFPSKIDDNEYVNRIIEIISKIGPYEINKVSKQKLFLKSVFSFFLVKKCDFVIINWLENSLRNRYGRLSLLGFFEFFLCVFFFRVIGRKVIYVRHNLYPHGMVGLSATVAKVTADVAEKLCDKKVSHSGHLVEKGYAYVPHPLYNSTATDDIYANGDYYIIFGRIERYKKIEDIIKLWNCDDKILVAGVSYDDEYLNELVSLSYGKNVEFMASFIEEDKAQKLVSKSLGLIVMHADQGMIVSGSFFYAITQGVPVFCIENDFFRWLKDQYSFAGLTLNSNAQALVKSLSEFSESFDFKKKLRFEAERNFGDSAVSKAWENIFKELLQ